MRAYTPRHHSLEVFGAERNVLKISSISDSRGFHGEEWGKLLLLTAYQAIDVSGAILKPCMIEMPERITLWI